MKLKQRILGSTDLPRIASVPRRQKLSRRSVDTAAVLCSIFTRIGKPYHTSNRLRRAGPRTQRPYFATFTRIGKPYHTSNHALTRTMAGLRDLHPLGGLLCRCVTFLSVSAKLQQPNWAHYQVDGIYEFVNLLHGNGILH